MKNVAEAEKDKFRLLFEHSSDGHLIMDDTGITDCNDAAVALVKCASRDDLLRIHPARLSPPFQPDGRASIEKATEMDRIAREKGFHRFEWVHRKMDGEDFPVQVTLNSITINGKPSVIGVWHDLTEFKRNEDILRRANEKMKKDLDAASLIQRTMLPVASPLIKGLKVSWAYRPCDELGGDSLNIFPLDDRHVGLFVLDVMGHGPAASLLSVAASHFLSPYSEASFVRASNGGGALSLARPASVAQRLNRHFSSNPENTQFFTMLYGVLDVKSHEFCYICAGHPLPVVLSSTGRPRAVEGCGYPIGVAPDSEYSEMCLKLKPRDRLYLYSDGITEAKNAQRDLFGEERLMQILERTRKDSLADSLDALVRAAESWADGKPDDDVTLLGCEFQ